MISDNLEKGKYHVFNTTNPTETEAWTESIEINSIENRIYLQLETTNINQSSLTVLSSDGSKLYHHFNDITYFGFLPKK